MRTLIRTHLGFDRVDDDLTCRSVRRQRAEQAIEDREDNEEEGATPAPRRLARARCVSRLPMFSQGEEV